VLTYSRDVCSVCVGAGSVVVSRDVSCVCLEQVVLLRVEMRVVCV